MQQQSWRQQLALWTYCILAFAIPYPYWAGSVSVILLLLVFCLTTSRTHLQQLRRRPALWVWIAYYVLHAASYFWSSDKSDAAFDLESKLSLLVLPLAIGASNLDRSRFDAVFAAFIWGLAGTAVYCFGHACGRYAQGEPPAVFFYHDLVQGLEANAVYSAWYVLIALSILLLGGGRRLLLQHAWVRWLVTALLLTYFGFLSARTLFVLFFLVPLPLALHRHWRQGHLRGIRLALACSTVLAVPLAVFATNNPLRQRFEDVGRSELATAFLPHYNGEQYQFSNLTTRLFLWRVGLENVQRHRLWLYGAGNGDVHELQNQRMAQLGLLDLEPNKKVHGPLHNTNLHNMAMQSLVMLGLPGLVLFLILAFQPLLVAARHLRSQPVWFVFALTGVVFMLQEAALQTQAGIIFYSFFSCLFWHRWYQKKESLDA